MLSESSGAKSLHVTLYTRTSRYQKVALKLSPPAPETARRSDSASELCTRAHRDQTITFPFKPDLTGIFAQN
jgi:hypothetical protein